MVQKTHQPQGSEEDIVPNSGSLVKWHNFWLQTRSRGFDSLSSRLYFYTGTMPIFLFVVIGIIVGASVVFSLLIFSFTIWSDLKGAPFVRSRKDRIETMLKLAEIRPGTRVLELGSGDGTLIAEAASMGAIAEGIEINPFLVWYSRRKMRRAGFAGRTTLLCANIFKISLVEKKPDVLLLYLLPGTLRKLREKLVAELPPGTRIISNAFRIDGLTPSAQKNNVYVYHL